MKIKFIIFVLTVFAGITAFSGLGISQTQVSDFGNIDFRTIKVDEISDDQIRQLIQKAEENGYSQQQIEAAAISKGMSQEEVQKLRLRMNTLQTGRGTQSMRTSSGLTRQEEQAQKRADLSPGDILTSMLTQPSDSLNRQEDPRTRIFGYSLFNTKDLTFEPSVNIPTPSKYILGPGDQLNIDIWGVSQQNYLLSISPDGYIVIDKVGPVLVSGLSAEEAS